ncbi:tetratricopeptide repeat protein [Flavobacterium muglaense]|uniref:Tetratricopeptide repeat protein n=1 Tax=Flavobacterium muglaense TaxID=2764716 RepID=A0A923N2E5_9FLAO|nr:tetratricopeptide repeat protein [Flavobacterium muglaense]MBC5837824.1 tetratricopeptide repeat protein [Flavobacterium muglaense]MBC5844418.1 tetratricopeptide repeat protein [Flavobacterium muglaense]
MKKLPHLLLISFIFICFTAQSQKNIWDENPSDSQVELDSLLTILPKSIGEKKLSLLNRIAEIYWVIDPNKTMKYGSEALRLSIEFKNKDQEGLALINLCQGYLFNNIYDKALKYGLQSLEIRKDIGNDYDLAFTLRTLGWLYYDIGYYEKALDYHTQALVIHEKIGDKQRIAYSYNSIGIIHNGKGDYNLALFFFKKSLKLIKDSKNKDRIAETMKNMGICYRKINELNLAKKFLESALDLESEIKYDYKKVYILHELAVVYLKLKNYKECYSLLEEAKTIIKVLGNKKELVLENDKIMSDYYLALNNYKEAFNFYMKYTNGNSEVFSSNKSEKLAEMRILYEAERRESEIKLLEQQRQLESQKRKSLLIGSILLAIIAILVIASLWNNIKKKKAIYLQNHKLSKEKLKSQFLLQENLERKLDFRTKELTNLALFISQRTNIYKDLAKSLKNLKFTDLSLLKQDINTLIKEYTFKFDLNEDIQQFHANVETLQSDFLFRIKEKHPNLTDKDIKLAVQVKLKLSSKEIANINNISANSVEIGRHRLRKKLGLENKDNLVVYLENI